ncbi:MAG: phenylalanine--tRNA ligase subunit beta [Nanoarchaeota archaeon]|mgnify:CR=1 FL=1
MPTIDVTLNDLHHLIGKPVTVDELDEWLAFAKGEVDSFNQKTCEMRISLEDTNQPYLWSAEGVAMLLRSVMGLETGTPKVAVSATKDEVIVDPSVKSVRPHIAVFSAKGPGVTDVFLRQLIQFQEKFCDAYGMKRAKVSIGIYRHDLVKFPVTYKAVSPDGIKFVPLGFTKQMTPEEILKEHPTGIAYAKQLEGFKTYPTLVDANGKVLSLIPIINSNDLGKIEIGDKDLMFECTGTDAASVELCANIFAHTLWMRGFTINSATVKDGKNKTVFPSLRCEDVKLEIALINKVLGTAFETSDVKSLLEKARHTVKKDGTKGLIVTIPSYRADVLHPIDLIEDVAIMADYNSLPTHGLTSYTVGDVKPIERTIDSVRDILAGLGMQEVLTAVLCNKELLYEKMNCADIGTVEISEYMSASYSCLRTWLVPVLMDTLSKNVHREYPQNLFETGEVCLRKKDHALDREHCGAVICSADADYTRVRQALDTIFSMLGVGPVTYEPLDLKEAQYGGLSEAFSPGRSAVCRVKGAVVAVLGEVNPSVLDKFEVRMPAAAFELDLSELHDLRGKK